VRNIDVNWITRSSAVAVIADRTANDVGITRPIEQTVVYYSRAIRFNRLDFMNAPELNPLKRDEQSSRCRSSQVLNSKAVFPLGLRVALRGERNRNTISVSISLATQRNAQP